MIITVTRHTIPSAVTIDWTDAVRRCMEGEELKSESDTEMEQTSKAQSTKGKGKARAKSKPKTQARSSLEAESSDTDSPTSDIDPVPAPVAAPRRSSRLAEPTAEVKREAFDVDLEIMAPRSPSSHSGHSGHSIPLFASGVDSDIEEIMAADDEGN